MGNLTIMLERISVLLTNQSNNDTGSLLIGWMKGKNPFPSLNNPHIETILLNACKDTPQYDLAGNKKDCFLNDDDGLDAPENEFINPIIPCGDGVDVSHWNGSIDWSAVASDKIGFAIIKASEGTSYKSEYVEWFKQQWNNSKGKVKRSAYHFFRPELDGAKQAEYFVGIVNSAGGGQDFTLAVDVETPCNMEGTSCMPYPFDRTVSTNNLKAFLDKVKALTGQNAMIYTSKYMWESVMTTSPSWGGNEYPMWVASWSAGVGTLPKGWTDYAVWQYSNAGSVAGISGRVDMNKSNPNVSWLPKSQCPTGNPTSNTTLNTNTTNTITTSNVLGAGSNRLTDIDSFKTYLKLNLPTAKTTNLCVGQSVGGSGNDDNVPVTYFPPGPTEEPEPTVNVPTVTAGPSPTPYIINGDCPFVQTDMKSAGYLCSQGPYGNWSHSCASSGYYALDLAHQGYGIAPEAGTVRFYPEGPDTGAGTCTRCGGTCLNTIKLTTASGRIYVFTHMVLSGVSSGQLVQKGQVIGVTIHTEHETNTKCSTGIHLDFSIIEGGVRISQIKQIYENMCKVTLKMNSAPWGNGCTNDNKCN
jgi:GH25 family lysozyme M1 (1,4-beta-N-acetylmuramidase)